MTRHGKADFCVLFFSRNCGNVFCKDCCHLKLPIPDQQLYDPVLVCITCHDLLLESRTREIRSQQLKKAIATASSWGKQYVARSNSALSCCYGPMSWEPPSWPLTCCGFACGRGTNMRRNCFPWFALRVRVSKGDEETKKWKMETLAQGRFFLQNPLVLFTGVFRPQCCNILLSETHLMPAPRTPLVPNTCTLFIYTPSLTSADNRTYFHVTVESKAFTNSVFKGSQL